MENLGFLRNQEVTATSSAENSGCQELEVEGESPECIFHVTRGGGVDGVELRMILPQLNRILCSNRVSSENGRTFTDMESLMKLLHDKERDIELIARIGKELLGYNQKLEIVVSNLEIELRMLNEKITQLQHELNKKTELLQILTNDMVEMDFMKGNTADNGNIEILQHRIKELEEKNSKLRTDATVLAQKVEESEQHDQNLLSDIISELSTAKVEVSLMRSRAEKQQEEYAILKQYAEKMQNQLQLTEQELAEARIETAELSNLLSINRATENELTTEVAELKERYSEVLHLLQETQDTLKQQKRSATTVRGGGLFCSLSMQSSIPSNHSRQLNSLSSELECSLHSELSLDSGITSDQMSNYRKVFETVHLVNGNNSLKLIPHTQSTHFPSLSQYHYLTDSLPPKSLFAASPDISDSAIESCDSNLDCSKHMEGIPGIPGSLDLIEALRRLTPEAINAKRFALSTGGSFDGEMSPDFECRTPDLIMSTSISDYTSSNRLWTIPQKLQIVKPKEGSYTLNQWSQLATPSLNGLLEERPGIRTRGGSELEDLGVSMFSLADAEEDEVLVHPGKSFQPSGFTCTYTNSTVLHPDDNTSLISSVQGVCMSIASTCTSYGGTPTLHSRRNSACTFSTSLGLAKILNERGITAATPSTLVTPILTPCNSPESTSLQSSPRQTRSSSPVTFSGALRIPGLLMSNGAEYLRRTLTGGLLDFTPSFSATENSRGKILAPNRTKGVTKHPGKIGLETLISDVSAIPKLDGENSRVCMRRKNSRTNNRATRPDWSDALGSVPAIPSAETTMEINSQSTSALGTLSSFLFGRKGGLL